MPSNENQIDPIQQLPNSSTVAETIIEQLHLWGVKRIYGVVGDAIFGLLDAIAKQNKIRFISVKHESVAAMMASAEAKLTGNIGVCIAQMGPGLANLINGLGDAYLDKAPVLAITGQSPLKKIGTPYKQLINQQQLMQAISGYSELVVHPDVAVVALAKGIHTAVSMNTVAHLSIPTDLFEHITYAQPHQPVKKKPVFHRPEQFDETVSIMESATSPMMMVGNQTRTLNPEIQKLAAHWGSGIVTAYGAIGMFANDFPFYLGGIGEGGNPNVTPLFKQADVILAIGTSWWPAGFSPVATKIIQIQDNEMKIGEGMPTDHGITGSIRSIITILNEKLQFHTPNEEWINQICGCHQMWSLKKESGNSPSPISPSSIVNAIERNITKETIIALDEGDSTLWFMENFKTQCRAILLSQNWRTMGFGLPAALSAKLTMPENQVICITGDGGLGMVLADLLTATRYKLPITVVVFNNGKLQMEKNKMTFKGLIAEGTDITNPDFAALAKACGWEAHIVKDENELEKLLQLAQTKQVPMLLDIQTAQDVYPNYQSE
ncbi:thiamine pyrophosphate-binding protein [Pseudogracilibacillus sp. SE30717A]|uniref:thiamine pyrophosphate-binding protein n=1 Tax=Pseudogracilibacillus sp. SE30717A TaxID=3098293 RepID=UPI00300E49F3